MPTTASAPSATMIVPAPTQPDTYYVTELDGTTVLGRIVGLPRTYRASRRNGTTEDVRRVGYGFRTLDAAAEWIGLGR